MDQVEKTVFLSYRRTNFFGAHAIYRDLTEHGFDAFFDFKGLRSGDFERVIVDNIRSRAHFVVLLTPSALQGCKNPNDWLRREIETAIESQRNIVPLMFDGFDFDTPAIAKQLTGTLGVVKSYNGLRIYQEYFEAGMERLRNSYLNVALTAVLHPASAAAQQAAREEKAAASAAPAIRKNELTAQEWFERSYAAIDRDDKIRFLSEAIRVKPDFPLAFYYRALVRNEKGEFDAAHDDYQIYLDLENAQQARDQSQHAPSLAT